MSCPLKLTELPTPMETGLVSIPIFCTHLCYVCLSMTDKPVSECVSVNDTACQTGHHVQLSDDRSSLTTTCSSSIAGHLLASLVTDSSATPIKCKCR